MVRRSCRRSTCRRLAAAAFDRVDRIARAAKSFGDVRTLAQLRADATLDLLSGRPFLLSPSLDKLTAEADQAARNLGYGVDEPHDLAGTMPPPKPRHRPGTRTSTKTKTKTTATQSNATQPNATQPNATQPTAGGAKANATETGAAKTGAAKSAGSAGAATATGETGATETGAGPGADPGVGNSGEHADRCGAAMAVCPIRTLGGILTVAVTTIRMNGPARPTSTSSPPCSPTTPSATTIGATPSTSTPSTTTTRAPPTRAPPTRLAECPAVNCPTLT